MENYIVSARKYRPSTFKSVVGQQVLTTTLKNAIKNNHLAHAYLFCGPRGVGKTTCARIFAKTINCQNPGSDYEPCNECESCKAFNENRSFNIHELDAASNNSVDDIRSLIDQVRIPPQIGKYSVFIIDEVHMLSTAAFNAFLKTLEEPPSYAIFILATTEKHKVLPTILSRCQVYDFNRITVQDTINYLKYVASQEGISATDEALNIVAQKADGGMRDALSIFDQLYSFCGKEITYEKTIETLNVLDYDYYFRLVDCFLNNDVYQSLLLFNEILTKGFQAQNFVSGLSQHIRDVIVSKDKQTIVLLDTSEQTAQRYAEQASRCEARFLFKALDLTAQCDQAYRTSPNKRLLVELMLVKLCQLTAPQEDMPAAVKPILTQNSKPVQQAVQQPTLQATPQPTAQVASTSQPAQRQVQQQTVQLTQQYAQSVQSKPQSPIGRFPQFSINNAGARQSGSVSAAKQEQETADESEDAHAAVTQTDQPLTIEKLNEVWKTLPGAVADNKRLVAAIQNSQPQIENGTTILFSITNDFLNAEVSENKQRLTDFLRRQLNNSAITIKTVVNEVEHARQAYTPSEMYQELLKENPLLDRLTNTFGLQLQ